MNPKYYTENTILLVRDPNVFNRELPLFLIIFPSFSLQYYFIDSLKW